MIFFLALLVQRDHFEQAGFFCMQACAIISLYDGCLIIFTEPSCMSSLGGQFFTGPVFKILAQYFTGQKPIFHAK